MGQKHTSNCHDQSYYRCKHHRVTHPEGWVAPVVYRCQRSANPAALCRLNFKPSTFHNDFKRAGAKPRFCREAKAWRFFRSSCRIEVLAECARLSNEER